MRVEIPDPWQSFLSEVDGKLGGPTTVHCLGGFVLAVLFALPRPTGDLDYVEVAPSKADDALRKIAGDGSDLAIRYHLKFQRVTIADYPDGYASRLINITPTSFQKLELLAFEVHDLVLAKIGRFAPRDREDIRFVARKRAIDPEVLQQRYEQELKPHLLNETRYVVNLDLCLNELLGAEGR